LSAIAGGPDLRRLGLESEVVDAAVLARTVERFAETRIALPTFAELADPSRLPAAPADVGPDDAHAANLYRVHWFNGADRTTRVAVPDHVVLPEALTGVAAPILVVFGNRFPMIRAHKVLAAYACLVPRLVSGRFDPGRHRAIWPSTGNYCRGGVAISRILGCRGVAVLPAGMSRERFEWLERWVGSPDDIVRTPGSESNVKEIYDECARLERDPENFVLNQFCEFANHLVHLTCTGPALERAFEDERARHPSWRLAAFTSATGSAGTIAAGDWLKDRHGTRILAAEALECPTLLYNGYGEHNIQGIGDKHVPLIHNVTNTDFVAGVSDESTDALDVLFNEPAGRAWLERERGLAPGLTAALGDMGFSSLCNVLSAIKLAKQQGYGRDDAIVTVATDGAELYRSEHARALREDFGGRFDERAAARVFDEHLARVDTDHLLELGPRERDRVFNLGYFTWVEQQGVSLADFEARRDQGFWRGLRELVPVWDERIAEFNRAAGLAAT
jgi:cysteine synthase